MWRHALLGSAGLLLTGTAFVQTIDFESVPGAGVPSEGDECVTPPVRRGGLLAGSGTPGTCGSASAQDLNARWCPSCPRPLHNPGAGAVVQIQFWYRDPGNPSNKTTSLSDAVEFTVGP